MGGVMKIIRLLFLLVFVVFVSCGTSETKSDGEQQKSAPAQTEKRLHHRKTSKFLTILTLS